MGILGVDELLVADPEAHREMGRSIHKEWLLEVRGDCPVMLLASLCFRPDRRSLGANPGDSDVSVSKQSLANCPAQVAILKINQITLTRCRTEIRVIATDQAAHAKFRRY